MHKHLLGDNNKKVTVRNFRALFLNFKDFSQNSGAVEALFGDFPSAIGTDLVSIQDRVDYVWQSIIE